MKAEDKVRSLLPDIEKTVQDLLLQILSAVGQNAKSVMQLSLAQVVVGRGEIAGAA